MKLNYHDRLSCMESYLLLQMFFPFCFLISKLLYCKIWIIFFNKSINYFEFSIIGIFVYITNFKSSCLWTFNLEVFISLWESDYRNSFIPRYQIIIYLCWLTTPETLALIFKSFIIILKIVFWNKLLSSIIKVCSMLYFF